MTRFKLALGDIECKKEDALDLFCSGIKSEQTKKNLWIEYYRIFCLCLCQLQIHTHEMKISIFPTFEVL